MTVLIRAYGLLRRETAESIDIRWEIPEVRSVRNAPCRATQILAALYRIDADTYYACGNAVPCTVTGLFTNTVGHGAFCYQVANNLNVESAHLTAMPALLRRTYIAAIRRSTLSAHSPYQRDLLTDEHVVDATGVPCGYEFLSEADLFDYADCDRILWVGYMNENQKKPMWFLEFAEALQDGEFVSPDQIHKRFRLTACSSTCPTTERPQLVLNANSQFRDTEYNTYTF